MNDLIVNNLEVDTFTLHLWAVERDCECLNKPVLKSLSLRNWARQRWIQDSVLETDMRRMMTVEAMWLSPSCFHDFLEVIQIPVKRLWSSPASNIGNSSDVQSAINPVGWNLQCRAHGCEHVSVSIERISRSSPLVKSRSWDSHHTMSVSEKNTDRRWKVNRNGSRKGGECRNNVTKENEQSEVGDRYAHKETRVSLSDSYGLSMSFWGTDTNDSTNNHRNSMIVTYTDFGSKIWLG